MQEPELDIPTAACLLLVTTVPTDRALAGHGGFLYGIDVLGAERGVSQLTRMLVRRPLRPVPEDM